MGVCPDSSGRHAQDESVGLEDGEKTHVAFQGMGKPLSEHALAAELDICVALSGWSPWNAPTEPLLRAMGLVQRARGEASAAPDTVTTCMRRAEALTELAYETSHAASLPESCRYQRLETQRPQGVPVWDRFAKGRSVTSVYLSVSSGILSEAALEQVIADGNCARHGRANASGNSLCEGMVGLSAIMLYNWRVLWWSLP